MKKIILLSFVILNGLLLQGAVRLPRLISDGMVLQRDAQLKLWGWADPAENVTLTFNKKSYRAAADAKGYWEVQVPAQKAGGPYSMRINNITLNDIYVGDVWVCSGQSNMETPMQRVLDRYADEVARANNPQVRFFVIPHIYATGAQDDLDGGEWKAVTPENINPFSALAYFYAQELYSRYKVPQGIIQSAVGGSAIEAWLSEDVLKHYPKYWYAAQPDEPANNAPAAGNRPAGALFQPPQDAGQGKWHLPDIDMSGWKSMDLPGYWADKGLGAVNGVFWFRKKITVPAELAGQEATLRLGCIVNSDSAWVNGTFVGTTGYQYPPRIYKVPAGVLKAGENVISLRVASQFGRGGFVEDKPFRLDIHPSPALPDREVELAGKWQYRIGLEYPAFFMPPQATAFRNRLQVLYDGMIAPLVKYSVKGILWYQGESNTGRAKEYATLFSELVRDWRSKWNKPNLPFLYVQLPNFMTPDVIPPQESDWAELREVQRKALATVPNTGMAVAIDLGEWNDIHPLNKKDVAHRLVLLARRLAYGENIVASGPLYAGVTVRGDSLVISFTETGSGLTNGEWKMENGELAGASQLTLHPSPFTLHSFALSADGKNFAWANAKIEGNTVVVWHDLIKRPAVVRYAWGDNPINPNLKNREGLPASPFSTE
ncbi:MAG: beta galactosidase jelly roll domain-containing protein [Prevotellaceae bacterium]|jgi:sialate O-acetylesterase|nr:beta galactosidase jelly roll domain-containing protein [Prevotellaceae bacterium]